MMNLQQLQDTEDDVVDIAEARSLRFFGMMHATCIAIPCSILSTILGPHVLLLHWREQGVRAGQHRVHWHKPFFCVGFCLQTSTRIQEF